MIQRPAEMRPCPLSSPTRSVYPPILIAARLVSTLPSIWRALIALYLYE
jgi:hypothetical protein